MNEFLVFCIILFGILQICLFFKIWGMCNNVQKLRERLTDIGYRTGVRKCIILGQKAKAGELIINKFIENISTDDRVLESSNPKHFKGYKTILEKELAKIGFGLPEEIKKMESINDFFDLF